MRMRQSFPQPFTPREGHRSFRRCSRFMEIVEKSLPMICCLLFRDKLVECSDEEIVWEKLVEVSQAAMEGR